MKPRVVIAFLLLGCAAESVLAAAGDAAAGKVVYEKNCRSCHGPTGQGNPVLVKASKGALQDLASADVQSRSDNQLRKDIAGGYGSKRAIKPLTEAQMQDVTAFVRTLGGK